MSKSFFVYMLASRRNGTLYVGMTSNLAGRIYIHKNNLLAGFTRRYAVHLLVWYEWAEVFEAAVFREKQLKKWRRAWKIRLIEEMNPTWRDLYDDLF